MNLKNNQNLFTKLASIAGLISASFLLHLPALALLQPETDSRQLISKDEQFLAQSEGGDSGDSDNGNSDNSNGDDSDSDSDSDNSDAGDTSDSASNGDDAGSDSTSDAGGDDGDSGEVFGTRSEDTEGGAPYLGVGDRPNDEDSFPQ